MTTSGPPVDPLLQGPSDQLSDPSDEASADKQRGRTTLAAVGVLAMVATLLAVVMTRGEEEPALQPVLAIDGWAPYWALDDSAADIGRRAGSMREISPFWFKVTGVTRIETYPTAPVDLMEKFLDNTRGARVVPSLVDRLPAGQMAAILADPDTRRRHVEAIVAFAEDGDYDGIDLNYEQFAFADGRDTWETTRPNWVSFVAEVAEELRDDGRTLTVSIPVVYDDGRTSESGYWVYDYEGIVDHVDHIRIMAYDYSVGEPGPIAPLEYVRRAIKGAIEATGKPEKLVLGIPTYGRNWVVSTRGTCPEENWSRNILVPGTTSVTARSVADLIGRRKASPVYDETTAEWSFDYELEISDGTTTCVQTRQVHYVDGRGVRERMDLAKRAGFGGIALWALGFEDETIWQAVLRDATPPTTTTVG
ncbi:MAG: glycosyl hydrolase family 18 protein [Actinomycetota bacterium]